MSFNQESQSGVNIPPSPLSFDLNRSVHVESDSQHLKKKPGHVEFNLEENVEISPVLEESVPIVESVEEVSQMEEGEVGEKIESHSVSTRGEDSLSQKSVAKRVAKRKRAVESTVVKKKVTRSASVTELSAKARKVIAEANEGENEESSDDVEEVSVIKKKQIKGAGKAVRHGELSKKSSPKEKGKSVIAAVRKGGIWFHSQTAAENWTKIQARKVIAEKKLVVKDFKVSEVTKLIKEAGLLKSVTDVGPFDEQLVRETVANITKQFQDEKGYSYGMVMVRGQKVMISPEGLNEHFDIADFDGRCPVAYNEIAQELTNNQLKVWKGTVIKSAHLTTKYAILHGICIQNWIPGSHRTTVSKPVASLIYFVGKGLKIDLGKIVFDQLVGHATSSVANNPIGCPHAIYQVVIKQLSEVSPEEKKLSPAPKIFGSDWKLFSGSHHVDVLIPASVQKALLKHNSTHRDLPVKASVKETSTKTISARNVLILKKLKESLSQDIHQKKLLLKEVTDLLRDIEYPEVKIDSSEDSEDSDAQASTGESISNSVESNSDDIEDSS